MAKVNGDAGFTQLDKLNITDELLIRSAPVVSNSLTNVVLINSPDDFPDAVGGVRELTNGADVVYQLAAQNIDMGTDVFTVTGGSCVVIGVSRFASRMVTAGASDFFTITDAFFSFEFAFASSPNSPYVWNYTAATDKTIVLQNAVVLSCQSVARIDSALVVSFRTLTTVATTVGGIDFFGTNQGLNITQMLATSSWTGTLLNLGTAVFDQLIISSDNRFISPAGTTILSGAAASANISATGRALVSGSIFNGLGAPLAGIDSDDTLWHFIGNTFADGLTLNSHTNAYAFLSAQVETTITTPGVYVAMGGTWSIGSAHRFTVSATGVCTYIGEDRAEILVTSISTVSKSGGGADPIATKIAMNGVVPADNETLATTTNNNPTGVSSTGVFDLETGDTLQVFTANLNSPANVISDVSSLILHEI